MKRTSFDHVFVDLIPAELTEGVLYVSVKYRTAAHNCACGCGNKVVTPIRPAGWHMGFDGAAVSLTPSINVGFPCRSHYWIDAGSVRWAAALTPAETDARRLRDAREYRQYFTYQRVDDAAPGRAGGGAESASRPWWRVITKIFDRKRA